VQADLDTQLHTHVSHAAGQLTTGNVSLGAMKEYVVQVRACVCVYVCPFVPFLIKSCVAACKLQCAELKSV
jgi:hypothetical protein